MEIKKVEEYVIQKHGNQQRKDGSLYYFHPLSVAKKLKEKGMGMEYQIAGLLHDVLEDTNATYQEIIAISSEEVAKAVVLVTKESGYDPEEYTARIGNDPIAKMVKLADRIHNLEESTKTSVAFQKRYLQETKKYYTDMAKGTIFEQELNNEIKRVERAIEENTKKRGDSPLG